MSKKSFRLQTNKMYMAALFTMLSVGVYAHIDGWVSQKRLDEYILGETTSTNATTSTSSTGASDFVQLMWCRLRFGIKCDQTRTNGQISANETDLPVEQLLEREIRNLENEIKIDRGSDQGNSYWSM